MKFIIVLFTALLLGACGQNLATAPGQVGNYQAGTGVNQKLEMYRLTGTVIGLGQSIQNYNMQGSATIINGTGSAYVAGGTSGKGYIRFHITDIKVTGVPTATLEFEPLVQVGDNVLLKTSDSKAASLIAGDGVVFLCRVQREFVEAVAGNEKPSVEQIVDELDYCRMDTPHFTPAS